ncbi:polysaccharide pyruvyl transferase family protein [Kocuria rosea]|uniref:Polysaccharide pyruvyl transferase family protein n=1 Tax=Kocuria rosea TaxID=1275 RepID=A0A4V3B1M3_KOCRO|nr:polysaccharide pyruvyl transferase family protein [Kocuria rosea]TDL37468.1 polysaccharide pyruvyl transferase family protein [Kocuria rosea]
MKVLLLHAYSAQNSGDGLLVELAKNLLLEARPGTTVTTVAIDATSFPDDSVVQWGTSNPSPSATKTKLNMIRTPLTSDKKVDELAEEAELIVGVGGGYMRGGTVTEAAKHMAAHFGQLRIASRHGHKAILLPQSIGPFLEPYGRVVRGHLSAINTVYVRDDISRDYLAALPNVSRLPDLAVLEMAEQVSVTPLPATGRPVIVARDLANRPGQYYSLMDALAETGRFDWAVQSKGRGNNDVPLTRKLAGYEAPDLATVLDKSEKSVVISTRLHGSMAALMAGVPTIHLSYERKGWGAFSDLGLDKYVLNARSTSPQQVLRLYEQLIDNQATYWASYLQAQSSIRETKQLLVRRLRESGVVHA